MNKEKFIENTKKLMKLLLYVNLEAMVQNTG